jgi:chromosome partitioning protein
MIIDADPQRSIARLASREKALGGVPVVEDATDDAWKTAQRVAGERGPIIIDTPGFRSQSTLACLAITDLVLVPVKPSPFDVDRMLDTLNILINGVSGRRPIFRCVLTQTTRDSVIAKHIRTELIEAGFPVLKNEMTNRVVYPEAALWGATPSLVDAQGPGARDIAAIANEINGIAGVQRATAAA